MVIEKSGNRCTCGNYGCFETYASMRALKEQIANKLNLKDISGREVYNLIKNNKDGIDKIINDYINSLKVGLFNIINIFEPEAICLGGSFVYFEDLLLDKLKNTMNEQNKTFNKIMPEILIAKLGNDAGMIGAVL